MSRRPIPRRRRFSPRRLVGLLRKEALQIVRDPSSISIAFVMPLVLLLLNGYGISLDAQAVPFGVVIENPSSETAGFWTGFASSRYFAPVAFGHAREAEAALVRGEIEGFAVLRGDLTRRLHRTVPDVSVQVIVNGVDANNARIVGGYATAAAGLWLTGLAAERRLPAAPPVGLEHRFWFNPEVRSTNFLVPGIIALVMTLIGALLTALIVAREWERGTMEAMMVSPASTAELLLGKLIAYFLLGMGGLAVALGLAVWLFEVPFRGSFGMLAAVSAAFLLAMLGLGLLISTVARNQLVAAQVAFIVTYMPALMLSGFLFDIRSMPAVVQAITRIVPARYFVGSLQTLFLAGDVSAILLPNLLALGGFALLFFALTLRRSRRRLD
ncbi:MAG: ABC transporter permease [Dongiaceae bacterium]